MFCPNCGKDTNVTNSNKFCSNCGYDLSILLGQPEKKASAPVAQPVYAEPETVVKKKKGSTAKIILVAILGLIIAGVAIALVILLKDWKSDKFLSLVEKGDYEGAAAYYEEVLIDDDKQEAIVHNKVLEEIQKVVTQFYSGEIEYESAVAELNKYQDVYSYDVNSAQNELKRLWDSQNNFVAAETYMQEEQYEEAQQLYLSVIKEDANYENAQNKAAECYELMVEETFAEIDKLISSKKYSEAMDKIALAESWISGEHETKLQITKNKVLDGYQDSIFAEIDELVDNNEFEKAFKEIDSASQILGNTDEINSKEKSVTNSYISYIKESIEVKITERDIDGAFTIVRKAQQLFPGNQDLIAMENDLQNYLPVPLKDIYVFEDEIGNASSESTAKDTYQNEYTDAIRYYKAGGSWGAEEYLVYLLNQDYEHFSFTVAAHDRWTQYGGASAVIAVYGDGVKLYERSMTRESKAESVELDVTGVEKLKIAINGGSCHILFGNPNLYKKY